MIKQYFQQAWAQFRQQPLIGVVNVAGTALAIFLIMLVVMMQQVKVVPFAPESNRDRFLHVRWSSITNKSWSGGGSSNGCMSVRTGREVYKALETPEAVTLYTAFASPRPVSLPNRAGTAVDVRETDDDFWRVFDFAFAYAADGLLFAQEYSMTLNPPTVDASILVHASTFLWALLFCFVLNLLSTGIPVWRAARMNIVGAIGGRLH